MYQLQERVLQELELVFEKFVKLPQHLRSSCDDYIVCGLDDSEMEDLTRQSRRTFGVDTLAIITFPADSDVPLEAPFSPMAQLLPALATLPTTPILSSLGESHDDLLPPHRFPVYNSKLLFPDQSRRNALRVWLEKLCSSPNDVKRNTAINQPGAADAAKTPTAFIIRNSRWTLERGVDMAPLAIALWRIRLWDGEGWRAPQG